MRSDYSERTAWFVGGACFFLGFFFVRSKLSERKMRAPLSVSPFVQKHAHRVEGDVLDLACGSGRHTRFFLDRGHTVVAVDKNVKAIQDLLSYQNLKLIECDLEKSLEGSWPSELEGRKFRAIVVVNYLYRSLMPIIIDTLDNGGVLIYETFAEGNERYGRPRNPNFLLKLNELIELSIPELTVLDYQHGYFPSWQGKECVKQMIVAQKPVSMVDQS